MNRLAQIGAVSMMALRSLPQRAGTSLVIVIGIGGVVLVLISVLAMATGFTAAMANAGRADRAIVLRAGSTAELPSSIARDAALTIMDASGVKRDGDTKPIGSAETVVLVE